jgi:signal transduction histidine kinase
MRLRPTGLRGRLTVAVALAVAVALGALLAAFNLVLDHQLDREATDVVAARATAELGTLEVVDGRLTAAEAPDDAALDAQVWVFAGSRELERPRAPAAVDAAASQLAGGPRRRLDVPGASTRLLAVPVVRRDRRIGAVVAGVSLKPYERTERIALLASLVLAAILLVAVIVVARVTLSAALRPVARMTAAAEDWSEHDLDRRFRLGPPRDELAHLAATLDRLLDRLAASLRREQGLTSEISHELRTPLAKVMAEAQLATRGLAADDPSRAALERVHHAAVDMNATLEVLLDAARAGGGSALGTTDLYEAASAVARTVAGDQDAHVATEVMRPEAPVRVAADAELVQRILVPIVDNARRHARGRVWIGIGSAVNGMAELTVRDDGPGVEARDVEVIFEAGARGRADGDTRAGSGAGLGLALARRLATAAGGGVGAQAGEGGRFTVRLPAA